MNAINIVLLVLEVAIYFVQLDTLMDLISYIHVTFAL